MALPIAELLPATFVIFSIWLFLTLNPLRFGSKFFLLVFLGITNSYIYIKWLYVLSYSLNLANRSILIASIQLSIFETVFLFLPTSLLLFRDFAKSTEKGHLGKAFSNQSEANFCLGLTIGFLLLPFFLSPATANTWTAFIQALLYLVSFYSLFVISHAKMPLSRKLSHFLSVLGCFLMFKFALNISSSLSFYSTVFEENSFALKTFLLQAMTFIGSLCLGSWTTRMNLPSANRSYRYLRCLKKRRTLFKKLYAKKSGLVAFFSMTRAEQSCLAYLVSHLCILWFAQDLINTLSIQSYLGILALSTIFSLLIYFPKNHSPVLFSGKKH